MESTLYLALSCSCSLEVRFTTCTDDKEVVGALHCAVPTVRYFCCVLGDPITGYLESKERVQSGRSTIPRGCLRIWARLSLF